MPAKVVGAVTGLSPTGHTAALVTSWRARAEQLDRYAPAAATAFRDCANELEALEREIANQVLGLTEAAAISGYTPDALGRMVRRGKLKNVGRHHAPRIRRGDLPVKPGHQVAGPRLVGQLERITRSALASRIP